MKPLINAFLPALLCVWLLSSCAFYEPTMKDVSTFKVRRDEGKGLVMDIGVKMDNPNRFRITLKTLELDVKINENLIATTTIPARQVLEKRSVGEVQFTVNTDLKKVMGGVLGVISTLLDKQKQVELQLTGHVTAKALGVSKRFAVDYKKPVLFGF